jgi:HSP20 family protein
MNNQNALQQTKSATDVVKPESTQGFAFTPRVDILESENELMLLADMPGVKPDGVDIRFENGELIIHGRCPERHPGTDFLLQEYGVGDFYRVFTVSESIDAGKISAEMKNGVLTVHLPKAAAVKPRRIEVKGA